MLPAVTSGRFDRSVTSPVADTIVECVTQFPLGVGYAGHPCQWCHTWQVKQALCSWL